MRLSGWGLLALSCASSALAFGCGGDSSAGDGGGSDEGGEGGDMDSGPPPDLALAAGITISEISEFQGTKMALMKNGGPPASKRAFAVVGKEALLRVYLQHDSSWSPHALMGILDVTAAGTTTTLTAMVAAGPDSTEATLSSTVNFDLTPDLMTDDAVFDVRIVEPDMRAPLSSDPNPARWPQDGSTISLETRSSGDQLKLTLVPLRYNADGSGRLPDTSSGQVKNYQTWISDTYPTPKVDITVHSPVAWASAIGANGSGWGSVLQYIANLRVQESAKPDVYYYGLFEPAASLYTYCAGGCVMGLALLGMMPTDTFERAACGVGYTGDESATTLLQELAHNMGRQHANCGGAQQIDPQFPYPNAGLGVFGYALSDKTLRSPAMYKDFMGYCQPIWVSDYTYKGLFDRIKFVNGASWSPGPPRAYRWATWDGKVLTYGPRFVGTPPQADTKTFAGVTGAYYPFDNVPGGLMIVPE